MGFSGSGGARGMGALSYIRGQVIIAPNTTKMINNVIKNISILLPS
jgi:hypothetical protein